MDLPLYNIDLATIYSSGTDSMEQAAIELPAAVGIEVLANKVVKFLLTIKGSDVLDSDYGCGLLEYTQISSRDLPRMQLELLSALERCTTYIKAGEFTTQSVDYQLHSIELVKLEYAQELIKDSVHIYLKIIAKSGQDALLEVPVG